MIRSKYQSSLSRLVVTSLWNQFDKVTCWSEKLTLHIHWLVTAVQTQAPNDIISMAALTSEIFLCHFCTVVQLFILFGISHIKKMTMWPSTWLRSGTMIVNNYSGIRVLCGVVVFFISFNFSKFMVVMRVISLQAVWYPSIAGSIFRLRISNAKHLLCHSLSTVSELIWCELCDNLQQTGAMQLQKTQWRLSFYVKVFCFRLCPYCCNTEQTALEKLSYLSFLNP